MSLNLHNIVRGAINRNFPDQKLKLFRSIGQENVNGIITAIHEPPIEIKGNFQSEGDTALAHANLAGQNSIIRKLYLYADDNWKTKPYGLFRPLARTGDYVQDEANNFWLVTSVLEDFSHVGWESLRCTMQQTEPDIYIKEPEDSEPDNPDKSEEIDVSNLPGELIYEVTD
ncbi:MAG: hypothetical protein K1W12_07555 [Turicimonas muris]